MIILMQVEVKPSEKLSTISQLLAAIIRNLLEMVRNLLSVLSFEDNL